jgi:dTDP-3-amino-3,4,6-trideoxy-alpha-D-glucose transaminase
MIPFNTLQPLHTVLKDEIDAAVQRVMQRGWYILGPEVEAFESEYAAWHGVNHAVGVANGTDAIELALRAYDIGADDEVITVSHTALPTVCAVERAGARPVLVDIDPQTYTIDPAAVAAAITPHTKAILPVHLYGQMADMDALMALAEQHHLVLIEDCAQSHGAKWRGKLAGTIGHAAAFSFYPTKNLGAYGDGGAVITNDADVAARLKRIRNYGQVATYEYHEKGMNSRLDEMQAAILRVKLQYLHQHNAERRAIAARYTAGLKNLVTPTVAEHAEHVYHLYVARHPQRDALIATLQQLGVGTKIHYPTPVHLAAPYQSSGYTAGALPVTEQAAREIVSLPLYIGMPSDAVDAVINAVAEATQQVGALS